jgi:hypothetical protein
MPAKIFLSYRRADARGFAHAIYNSLTQAFAEDHIFMDVNTLIPGVDAVKALEDAVEECTILLAVIGNQWEHIKDENGQRRLDKPEDFVRIEISHALKLGITVIPVLVNEAKMPSSENLPEDMKLLSRRQAHNIGDHFNSDVSLLIEVIKKTLIQLSTEQEGRKREETRRKEQIADAEKINIESSIQKGDQLFFDGNGDIAKRIYLFIIDQVKNNHLDIYIPTLKQKISLCQELIRYTDQFHEILDEISKFRDQKDWGKIRELIDIFSSNLPKGVQFNKIRNHMLSVQNEIIRLQEISTDHSDLSTDSKRVS